jgi:hypothetical protein
MSEIHVRRGVTRAVVVGRRWVVKFPRLQLFSRSPETRIAHSRLGWATRGWLANRSEWRQRHRPDVAQPVLTLGHLAVVFPAAARVGGDDIAGPWLDPHGRRDDECKPDSWGLFPDGWRIIDFDHSWEEDDRGVVGRLYYGRQERLARQWGLPPWWKPGPGATDAT